LWTFRTETKGFRFEIFGSGTPDGPTIGPQLKTVSLKSLLRKVLPLLAILASGRAIAAPSQGDPAGNMRDLETYFAHCIQSPVDAQNSKTTFYFSMKSDGYVLGQPRIAWAGSQDKKDHIVSEFRDAFAQCLPLVLTEDMARTIPGKVYLLQLTVGQDGTDVRLRPYGSMGPPLVDAVRHR
jgi:hypothetical protein